MNIFQHCFEELTEEDKKLLQEYFYGYDYRGAGYTFFSNYIWRTTYCLCWDIIDDYMVMAGSDCLREDAKAVIAMPLTKDGTYEPKKLREAILKAKNKFQERKIDFSIEVIPEHMIKYLEAAFPQEMIFCEDRDDDEYVYLKEKMITLSGRVLHKKKNHMNYFKKNYSYEARPLTLEDKEDVLALVKTFIDGKENPASHPDNAEVNLIDEEELETLKMEEEAITEAMKLIEYPNIYSIGLYLEGNLKAFSIGERLNENTAVAHFEKAKDGYRGIYQVVASEFCKALPEDIVYINREEDMGIENLRQAKEALRPDHMVKKYSAVFK